MAESKSIDQWHELVKSCNESGQSKAAFCLANAFNYIDINHRFRCKRNNLNHQRAYIMNLW